MNGERADTTGIPDQRTARKDGVLDHPCEGLVEIVRHGQRKRDALAGRLHAQSAGPPQPCSWASSSSGLIIVYRRLAKLAIAIERDAMQRAPEPTRTAEVHRALREQLRALGEPGSLSPSSRTSFS